MTVIEVESGAGKRSRSLINAVASVQGIDLEMRLSDSNISLDENGIGHYPLSAVGFMEGCQVPDLGPVDYMDDFVKALYRERRRAGIWHFRMRTSGPFPAGHPPPNKYGTFAMTNMVNLPY